MEDYSVQLKNIETRITLIEDYLRKLNKLVAMYVIRDLSPDTQKNLLKDADALLNQMNR